MLAYVFWHWPMAGFEREYEERLIPFQHALQQAVPGGFRSSAVFRIPSVPWTASRVGGYEDWYILDGSAALDALNDAAVSARCRTVHDTAAAAAGGGTAGLYKLRLGTGDLNTMRHATWFAKPRGISYEALYGRIKQLVSESDCLLWGRQMVLGPKPEFCLHTAARVELPTEFEEIPVELARIWP